MSLVIPLLTSYETQSCPAVFLICCFPKGLKGNIPDLVTHQNVKELKFTALSRRFETELTA